MLVSSHILNLGSLYFVGEIITFYSERLPCNTIYDQNLYALYLYIYFQQTILKETIKKKKKRFDKLITQNL